MSLSHAILGVLAAKPRHGYAIQRALREIAGSFWPINQGQIYATLARLEHRELIRPRPTDSGQNHSSDVRCYDLSPAGLREWRTWLAQPDRAERNDALGFDDWAAHLATCQRRGERELLVRVIELQRRRCLSLQGSPGPPTPGLPAIAARAAQEILEAELRWLDCAARELLATPDSTRDVDSSAPEPRHETHESTADKS